MPTPIRIEGFEHQKSVGAELSGGACLVDAVANGAGITFDTTNKRTGAASLKLIESGAAATNIQLGFASTQVLVGSAYFRATAAPSVDSRILRHPGPAESCKFLLLTTGAIATEFQGSDRITGPSIVDGNWHRLDWRITTSGTTHTTEWYVDNVQQTSAQIAGIASNMTDLEIGSSNATHTATFWVDDLVLSVTSGDYPLGGHTVLSVFPNADGTHNAGTNIMEDSAGTDIGVTAAWSLLDEAPPTGGSDFVRQSAVGASNYAEVLFTDTSETEIWGVEAVVIGQNADATLSHSISRILDSANTTLVEVLNGDMGLSNANLHAFRGIVSDPGGGGWTQADFNGLKARIGFSTDATPNIRWASILLQYAVPEVGGAPPVGKTKRTRVIRSGAVQRASRW